ncbi:MAG TPA: FecR family protein [Thermoanaerobaculia bacterium]|nr:FecR family protein [Thermoanaerobaculia bacterium]
MNDDDDDTVAKLVRMAGRRPQMDPERMARVREAVYDEWQRGVTSKRRWRLGIATTIAAAVAATVAGVLLLRPEIEPPQQLVPVARILETKSDFASHDWDGATLRLDTNTRVIVAGDVATLERGAIYYSSERSTKRIRINTPLGDVRDVGTQFEVRLDSETLRVRVREGVVELRGTTAGAGTQLTATATTLTQQRIPIYGDTWSWIEHAAPPIALEGETLGSVIDRIAHEKGLRVRWDTTVRDAVLHGNVPLTIDEALDAATAAAGVSYRIEGDELVVTR